MFKYSNIHVKIPGTDNCIYPGMHIKLSRFDTTLWEVRCDWYSFDDNRLLWGLHLIDIKTGQVKPLLKSDLLDVYMME